MEDQKKLIEQMYGSTLESQKEQLNQNYNNNISSLDQQIQKNARDTQKKLNATTVESDRARKNYMEVQNAYGLTSGAMAQARLAQDNQLAADMATIRAAQQTADQNIETEKTLLAKQLQSEIAKAQADNDFEKAQALYNLAKQEDERLLNKQKTAAEAMAAIGDYSLYGQLYGLTPEQIASLEAAFRSASAGSSGGRSYSGGSSGGSSDSGDYSATNTTPKNNDSNSKNSALQAARKKYPGGVISNPFVWDELAASVGGTRVLEQNGFSFRPAASNRATVMKNSGR